VSETEKGGVVFLLSSRPLFAGSLTWTLAFEWRLPVARAAAGGKRERQKERRGERRESTLHLFLLPRHLARAPLSIPKPTAPSS
jgi:hypothetical protein